MNDDSNLTPAQLAEQAGAAEASRAIELMQAAGSQAERLSIFSDSLRNVVQSNGANASIDGFCVVLIAWLDLAMKK